MKRDVFSKIKEWNVSGSGRKPLVMMGARQVGKTWLLTAFADECYSGETVFVDLHDDGPLRDDRRSCAFHAFQGCAHRAVCS